MVISRSAMQSILTAPRLVARNRLPPWKRQCTAGMRRHPRTHCSRDFPCTGSRQQHMRHSLCPFRPTDSVSGCRAWARTQTGKRWPAELPAALYPPHILQCQKGHLSMPFCHTCLHACFRVYLYSYLYGCCQTYSSAALSPISASKCSRISVRFHRTGTGPPSSACRCHIPGPVLPGTA